MTLKLAKDTSPRTLKAMDWNQEALFLDNVLASQAKRRIKKNDV
jgi:hypothetical protein